MSYHEFQSKCMINKNFLEFYGIVGAVQKVWKKLISEYGRLHDIENDIVDRLKSDKKKPCIYFYNLYLENIKESSFRSQTNGPRNYEYK